MALSPQIWGINIVRPLRDSHMDPRIARLKTPQECERFAKNADALNETELAKAAKKRAVELRALEHGAESDAEREALEAIYAVEEIATQRNGRCTGDGEGPETSV